jgi:3-keto-L-gulonate 6-phosphate decarboxylase (EC 4.1.1.85)
MSLPMLQVALDNQTMDSAYETTRLIAEEVDIIEVGTILCVGEGVRAVRDLKALYPHKIVLADAKIADAGKILSRMCFEANADWVTVICCADINTAKGALDVAKEFNGDVQIELTGYWTWEQAQQWRDAGIQQVVYHRSRDAQAAGVAWGKRTLPRSNVFPIWASKSPSLVAWRWKICRCSKAFRSTSLLPVAASVMPPLR